MMRSLVMGLAVAACGLLAVVVWEAGAFAPPDAPLPAPPRIAATAATQPIVATNHEGEWLATILARPLFSPDRRPASATAVVQNDRVPDNLPRLSGILVGPFGRNAIFAVDGAKAVVVGEGGRIKAWTVRVIQAGEVQVEGPGGARTVRPSFQSLPSTPDGQAPIGQQIGLSLKQ